MLYFVGLLVQWKQTLIANSKDHYVVVFDLTSMQEATEKCYRPEVVGEPLRLERKFVFSLEQVTDLNILGEQMSWVAVDKVGGVGKSI